jgi:hypothetical protein
MWAACTSCFLISASLCCCCSCGALQASWTAAFAMREMCREALTEALKICSKQKSAFFAFSGGRGH